jgi:hypothetical protein
LLEGHDLGHAMNGIDGLVADFERDIHSDSLSTARGDVGDNRA